MKPSRKARGCWSLSRYFTKADAGALARPVRRRILARRKSCGCGCQGADSQHRRYFDRVVHDVNVTLDSPRTVSRALRWEGRIFACERLEIATATARFPWSPEPLAIRCVIEVLPNGERSELGEWELVELR